MGACSRAKLVRKLLKEHDRPPNVVPFRKTRPEVEAARQRLVGAIKEYCITNCGGCELTGHGAVAAGS